MGRQKLKFSMEKIKSTTVVAIRHKGEVVIGADGQATLGNTVAKSSVKKILFEVCLLEMI